MPMHYSDPSRANDAHALPDVEIFYIDSDGHSDGRPFVFPHEPGEPAMGTSEAGWYWWPCFPGCLPDGDPIGPFDTEAEALADARESYGD